MIILANKSMFPITFCTGPNPVMNIDRSLGASNVRGLSIFRNWWYKLVNPFTPTDRFSSFQNNEWKSPLKLLSVERVNNYLSIWALSWNLKSWKKIPKMLIISLRKTISETFSALKNIKCFSRIRLVLKPFSLLRTLRTVHVVWKMNLGKNLRQKMFVRIYLQTFFVLILTTRVNFA